MKSIPDDDFDSYYATLSELREGNYKARVNRENRNHDYRKFAATKEECNIVIRKNISKACGLIQKESRGNLIPTQGEILAAQLNDIQNEERVAVLSTCPFFIPEYNPKLID